MGADYIGLGLTIDPKVQMTEARALEVLETFRDSITNHIAAFDYNDYFDMTGEDVIDVLASAVGWLEGEGYTSFAVPDFAYLFIAAGGMSWGDSPFEEFDAVVLLGGAVEVVPGLGRAVGVLGEGICLDYSA